MKSSAKPRRGARRPTGRAASRSASSDCVDHEHAAQESRAFDALKASGLKRTRAREAVIRFLSHRHGPFTVEEIFQDAARSLSASNSEVSGEIPCDLATIYRILGKFQDAGLVARTEFGDGVARFEIAQPNDRHHHHVVCLECGRAEPIRGCDLKGQEESLRRQGFAKLSHRLEFFAICPACQKRGS